jgi:hypothetical protein
MLIKVKEGRLRRSTRYEEEEEEEDDDDDGRGTGGENCVLFKNTVVASQVMSYFMNTIIRNSTRVTVLLVGKYRGLVVHRVLLHSEAWICLHI